MRSDTQARDLLPASTHVEEHGGPKIVDGDEKAFEPKGRAATHDEAVDDACRRVRPHDDRRHEREGERLLDRPRRSCCYLAHLVFGEGSRPGPRPPPVAKDEREELLPERLIFAPLIKKVRKQRREVGDSKSPDFSSREPEGADAER